MLMLQKDRIEAAAFERRRRAQEERKIRFFNPRNVNIGIDVEFLEKQVAERKAREQQEADVNEAFETQRVRDARSAILLEKQIEEEVRAKCQAIDQFRATHQAKDTRREFDLYDPDGLKKAIPARVSDNDERCTVSSAQRFEGEDTWRVARAAVQHEQTRAWLEQQIAERRAADALRRAADAEYETGLLERDRRAMRLDRQEQEVRRQQLEAASRYNQALAQQKAAERARERRQNEEVDCSEMYNNMTGDMLTENPDGKISAFGVGHIVGNMYRGLSAEERAGIKETLLEQMAEDKARQDAATQLEADADRLTNEIAHRGVLLDREIYRAQRELNQRIVHQNSALAREQQAHQRYLKDVVYRNDHSPAYYDQFSKTA